MDTNARAKALSTATGISNSDLIGILNKELGDPKDWMNLLNMETSLQKQIPYPLFCT